jgi:hypothetical protein
VVVDIDWEYPGGNGAEYKVVPNEDKSHEIDGFPKMLSAVRKAIGADKLLSIAVPGKKEDMIAYTAENGPLIWPSVDYINVSFIPSLKMPLPGTSNKRTNQLLQYTGDVLRPYESP